MLEGRDHRIPSLLEACTTGGTLCSNHPQSEVTCNASGSRKRTRDHPSTMAPSLQVPHHFQYPIPVMLPDISTGMQQPSQEQNRLYGSGGTSASGISIGVSAPSLVVSPLTQELISTVQHQSVEMDALTRLHTERLRSRSEEAQKRHCIALLSVLEQQAVKRLEEKETELADASKRNVELEEMVKQMSMENQIWFNVAMNNEAIVSRLRATLELVLLQNIGCPAESALPAKEVNGDSDGIPFPADDAQSCCFENEERDRNVDAEEAVAAVQRENEELRFRKACRVCREREVCVLLLPCRHLCLCRDCESGLETCPVCHSSKNASIHIFLS